MRKDFFSLNFHYNFEIITANIKTNCIYCGIAGLKCPSSFIIKAVKQEMTEDWYFKIKLQFWLFMSMCEYR